MSVTIVKAKTASKATPASHNLVEVLEPEKLTVEELADQYGRLQNEIVRLQANPVYAQFALVQEELQKRLEPHEPDEIVKIKGKHYLLEAGACKKIARKVVNVMKVMDWLGTDVFAKIAKVGVSDAEKYLNPEQCSEVMDDPGFSKNRSIKVEYLG
jgi:uncharacterized small protein (DUF1192 family)